MTCMLLTCSLLAHRKMDYTTLADSTPLLVLARCAASQATRKSCLDHKDPARGTIDFDPLPILKL